MSELRAGFIPLVDCAVLVVAARMGFARAEGLKLKLEREASWATLRDKLTVRAVDCAHLLAPVPVASQLRIGHPQAAMVAPFALSRNGNAISVSHRLHAEMAATGRMGAPRDAAAKAEALAEVVKARAGRGQDKLVLGMVHPFSGHNFELRYWLAAAGIHPDRDVELVVIPPPFIVDHLAQGLIDGFCVGAPWNVVGVRRGLARTIVVKPDIWRFGPEKVLAVREDFAAEDERLTPLMRSLKRAALWADDPANRAELAALLAAEDIIAIDAELIAATLAGAVPIDEDAVQPIADYMVFERDGTNVPRHDHALWFYAQMVRWGQAPLTAAGVAAARRAFRPDLFTAAFPGEAMADASRAVGGFLDGNVFDPAAIDTYLAGLAVRTEPLEAS
ncbi:MAG: CmpA/NrtA family ABC transporter substrate-binding protein [Acuticoccus sp.]